MDLEKIEHLIKLIENSGVKKFSYSEDGVEIKIDMHVDPVPAPAAVPMFPMGGMPAAAPAMPAAAPAETASEEEPLFITSPIVATFYSAAGPDIPAYVRVGDKVRAGETVCILEAMKLMNEISADFDCVIEAILVSNEQHVEYGQPLFRVKKI